jgi:ribosomal protein S18 acetylase RimI-like enzyme
MSVTIRPLTLDRLGEALQVWEATLGNGFKLDRQEVADRLQNGTGLFYIALDDETDRVVGIKFGYMDGEVCIGRGIGVLPEYRRQGIATRLLRHFEQDLQANPAIKVYAFGSATTEGVPFHIAVGYYPQVLVQFTDRDLRPSLDFTGFTISQEGYNETYQMYQIFIPLEASQANLDHLRALQVHYPQVNIQYLFEKAFPSKSPI